MKHPENTVGEVINNVLIGKNGNLFLHEGSYNQFSFLSGKQSATKNSQDNFATNLRNRRSFADKLGIPYLHVVVPCKPLVCKESLPHPYEHNLTSLFLRSYTPCLKNRNAIEERVLYPLAALIRSQLSEDTYWKNDTHINAAGQLCLYREISKHIPGFSHTFPEFRTVDSPRVGDLSMMMKSELPIQSRCFAWMGEVLDYSNTKALPGNTGDLAIRLNPLSRTERRLVILGDSFIKTILHLFSQDFRTVIYIRGPYFQSEMIERFKPDVLITSETERYLAGVDSDQNGKSLYPGIVQPSKGYLPSTSFKTALEAQLEYKDNPQITHEWEQLEINQHRFDSQGIGSGFHNQHLKKLGQVGQYESIGECPVIHISSLDNISGNILHLEIEAEVESRATLTVLSKDDTMSEPYESIEAPIHIGNQILELALQSREISGLLLRPLHRSGIFTLKKISWKKGKNSTR